MHITIRCFSFVTEDPVRSSFKEGFSNLRRPWPSPCWRRPPWRPWVAWLEEKSWRQKLWWCFFRKLRMLFGVLVEALKLRRYFLLHIKIDTIFRFTMFRGHDHLHVWALVRIVVFYQLHLEVRDASSISFWHGLETCIFIEVYIVMLILMDSRRVYLTFVRSNCSGPRRFSRSHFLEKEQSHSE